MYTRGVKVASLGWLLVLVGLPARADDTVKPVAAELYLSWRAPVALSGTVTYTIECLAPCRDIELDADDGLWVTSVRVDGNTTPSSRRGRKLVVRSRRDLPEGRHSVALTFHRTIVRGGIAGHKLPRRRLLLGRFEPQGRRHPFPSFDDLRWRIPWTITLEAGAGDTLLSNALVNEIRNEGSRRIARFATTVPLPAHLVAVAAGRYPVIDRRPAGRNHIPLAVHSTLDWDLSPFAQQAAASLAAFEDWTGAPFPGNKLDVVVVEDSNGWLTLETPGLTPVIAPFAYQWVYAQVEHMGLVFDHALVHQWYGVSLLPATWEEAWVNRGIADWYAVRRAAGGDACPLLREGFLERKRPLRGDPWPGDQGSAEFAGPAMWDTGAVFCAIDDWWTVATGRATALRDAVRAYALKHAGGQVDTVSFLASLDASEPGLPTGEVLRTLSTGTVVPVLTYSRECGEEPKLHLSLRVENAPFEGPFPVVVQALGGPPHAIVVRGGRAELAWPTCDGPVIGDAGGSGAYQVVYQPEDLEALTEPENWRLLSDNQVMSLISAVEWGVRNGRIVSIERIAARLVRDIRSERIKHAYESLSWALAPEEQR